MKKVMLMNEFSGIGGAEIILLELVKYVKSSYEVSLVTDGEGLLQDRCERQSVPVFYLPFQSLKSNWLNPLKWIRFKQQFNRVFCSEKPQMVYCNSFWVLCCILPAIFRVPVPVICGIHADIQPKKTLKRWLFSQTSGLFKKIPSQWITVSSDLKNDLVAYGVSSDKITIIANGIDSIRFSPRGRTGRLRNELQCNQSTILIGTTGRLHPGKGQDRLILYCADLMKKKVELKVVIIGSETKTACENLEFESALRNIVSEQNMADCVHFLGFREDLSEILPDLDIYVSLSRQESFGLSVLEAMSSGLPVVAEDVGGLRQLIRSNDNGFLLPPDDKVIFVETLLKLSQSIETRSLIGKRARETALLFNQEACLQQWSHTFDSLISRFQTRNNDENSI